jgi:hypothetical protein
MSTPELARDAAAETAEAVANVAGVWEVNTAYFTARAIEHAAQAALLRCIFGNPFRPAAPIDASWRTPEVTALATAIYDKQSFDRLPELAAHLEAAGYTDPDILGHCRGPGPHARACWVVDLVLGKK